MAKLFHDLLKYVATDRRKPSAQSSLMSTSEQKPGKHGSFFDRNRSRISGRGEAVSFLFLNRRVF